MTPTAPLLTTDLLTSDLLTIDVESVNELGYAMAHNAVPFINRLTLHHRGHDVPGADLSIEVRDAQGSLSRPWSRLVDLSSSGDIVLTALTATLDPAAMLGVEEQRPASVIITVTSEGRVLGRREVDVTLLAAHQWLSRPTGLGLEMLAAFVMPNHPAVAELLSRAGDVLHERTGSGSIQGYQAGSERADEIAEAIWSAMQERRIRYSEPPASWSDVGQKIRTPGQVLTERVGTCLDTTLVMAAALEQAGLHPLLWITSGHAFVGYWRREVNLAATVSTDVPALVNRVDLGLIQLVETTLVTDREEPVPFSATHRSPYLDHLGGNPGELDELSDVIGVVDVVTARQSRIIPLPARTRSSDGSLDRAVQIVEYHPAAHSTPPARAARAGSVNRPGARENPTQAVVPARVQQWKSALLDLSLNNRLINHSARQAIHLTVPDSHLGALEDLVNEGRALRLLPDDAFDEVHRARGITSAAGLPAAHLQDALLRHHGIHLDVPAASYSTRLAALAYKARTITEETGANNLYLALGTLVWEIDQRTVRSPLVLVPVTLSLRGKGSYRLQLDESGASTPNYCLLEKLRQMHDLEVPGLAEPETDAAGIDLEAALDAVRTAIADAGLSARVEESADLGVLQFAKFRLWKDLDEHWETFLANPLVRHLVESPNDPFEDPAAGGAQQGTNGVNGTDLDELAAQCPVAADASQLAAVADAVAGRTFVLQGPPGTGKSQTITNMLARALADGSRVLFVAEKRAALDVVRERLDAVGMGPFSLDLHDKASRPTRVRAQIRAALEHTVDLDEQGLLVAQDDLRATRRALARYAARLHETNDAGLSLYSARTQSLALGEEGPALTVGARLLRSPGADALPGVRRCADALPDIADAARPSRHHPWGLLGYVDGALPDLGRVRTAAIDLDAAIEALVASLPTDGPLPQAVRSARHPGELWVLAELAAAPDISLPVLDTTRTPAWQHASADLVEAVARFAETPHPGFDVALPTALGLPLGQLHEQALAARASRFFGRTKRLRAVGEALAPGLRPGAGVPPRELPEFLDALAHVQAQAGVLKRRAGDVAGLHLPPGWNPLLPEDAGTVAQQVSWLAWAGASVGSGEDARALRDVVGDAALAAREPVLRAAADALVAFADAAGVQDAACARWAGDLGVVHRWRDTAAGRDAGDESALALRRYEGLLRALEPLRAAGLDEAYRELLDGELPAQDAVRALDRGVALACVRERAASTGLEAFDPLTHDATVTRFTSSAAGVRTQMSTQVPRQVLASRPFDPASARGRVGELQRQLGRQRGGLGVRALMSTYGDLIVSAMPCVLVSPDSLARFFPARADLFDIVVFDEASQIRVADAIGAMGRGRSVVVVGDSKQMPPTSFGEAGGASGPDGAEDGDADDEVVVPDQESILGECVLARVRSRWLSWHYRSQDESLIAFSNRYYYEDRLSSFPAPPAPADRGVDGGVDGGADGGRGISLVRVDGHFIRSGAGLRTNPVEARAVVAEIRARFDASPGALPSLGVITFNAPQRTLVEQLLADLGDERISAALADGHGGLFVKNLENVQGDERDVVLFSTAFSANERGVLPLNFGPLNRGGGERRLNVAVTRARRQVVVFASFDPQDLRAEQTTSVGVKHLRAYLDLAAAGPSTLPPGRRRSSVVDRHRDDVADALRRRGLVVATGVGLSDFTIDLSVALPDDPDRAVLAVLLDGPAWAARRTVGDRDGLPVEVLSTLMRWPAVERVWMPDWLARPAAVAQRLEQAARAAARPVAHPAPGAVSLAKPTATSPSTDAGSWTPKDDALLSTVSRPVSLRSAVLAPSPVASVPSVLSVPQAGAPLLLGEEPFVEFSPGVRGPRTVLDELPSPAAVARVRAVLVEAVAAEGPIHRERLARVVAGAFGLSRVSASRAAAVLDALPREGRPRPVEPFAWPPDRDPASWTAFRRGGADALRPLDHVCLREIGNAMVSLCSSSGGMFYEELLREALGVFGGRRITVALSARLEEALVAASAQGRLHRSDDGVWSAPAS